MQQSEKSNSIRRVIKNDELFSLIIPADFTSEEKYNFITPNENFLQIGINYYEANDRIPNHIHTPLERTVTRTEEIIVLKKGRMKVFFFDESKSLIHEDIMETGDTLYTVKGGHGFQILEPSEIFEVKQGPYISKNADKIEI